MSTPQSWLNYYEAAAQLGVSYATIRRYVAQGRIEVVRINARTIRIKQEALDAFIARNTEPATAA